MIQSVTEFSQSPFVKLPKLAPCHFECSASEHLIIGRQSLLSPLYQLVFSEIQRPVLIQHFYEGGVGGRQLANAR